MSARAEDLHGGSRDRRSVVATGRDGIVNHDHRFIVFDSVKGQPHGEFACGACSPHVISREEEDGGTILRDIESNARGRLEGAAPAEPYLRIVGVPCPDPGVPSGPSGPSGPTGPWSPSQEGNSTRKISRRKGRVFKAALLVKVKDWINSWIACI